MMATSIGDLLFRTGYDFAFGDRADVDCSADVPLVVQASKDECDINLIIARAERGIAPPLNAAAPVFADVSEAMSIDYQTALNAISLADAAFAGLNSSVRARFENSPALLLGFLADERNRKEALELGLIAAPAVDEPVGSKSE